MTESKPADEQTTKDERREHERVDLLAQVQVTRESEVHILSTSNISHGGVFLLADPAEVPDLERGAEVELVIFPTTEPTEENDETQEMTVSAQAKVVRIEDGKMPGRDAGFGLRILKIDPDNRQRLRKLIKNK